MKAMMESNHLVKRWNLLGENDLVWSNNYDIIYYYVTNGGAA